MKRKSDSSRIELTFNNLRFPQQAGVRNRNELGLLSGQGLSTRQLSSKLFSEYFICKYLLTKLRKQLDHENNTINRANWWLSGLPARRLLTNFEHKHFRATGTGTGLRCSHMDNSALIFMDLDPNVTTISYISST